MRNTKEIHARTTQSQCHTQATQSPVHAQTGVLSYDAKATQNCQPNVGVTRKHKSGQDRRV